VSPIIECRRPLCCHSRAYCSGPAQLAGEAGSFAVADCSGAPLHASDTVKDSLVIIACNAAPPLLGGGDGGGISFSKRSQHLDGQLLQAPVTLGRFTTTLRILLGCCQPRCLPNLCLPIPASLMTETRIPYGFPAGRAVIS
jgi:hypothetical protein